MAIAIVYVITQMLLHFVGAASASTMPASINAAAPLQNDNRDDPGSDTVIKASVMLVPVDIVVRDRKGAFKDDLAAEDFVVYDNGVVQDTTFFSREETPLDVALVVDGSNSEAPYVLQLRDIAMSVLENLNPKDDRVALFCFGTFPLQLTGLTKDRLLLAGMIAKIPNMDNTNIKDALWSAAQCLRAAGSRRRRAIILISDNYESIPSEHTEQELLDELLETGIVLYSIKTPGINPTYMRDSVEIALFAKETGGQVIYAESVPGLAKALTTAITSLKHSYTIGFSPSGQKNDGSFHQIKVKLKSSKKCPGCKLQARSGYQLGQPAASALENNIQKPAAKPLQPLKGIGEAPAESAMMNYLAEIFNDVLLNALTRNFLSDFRRNDRIKKAPEQPAEAINFTAKAARSTDTEGRQTVKIDIKLDAATLFYSLSNKKYKAWLAVIVAGANVSDSYSKIYQVSIPEGQFQLGHRETPLSMTIPAPAMEEISVLVFEPFHRAFSIRTIPIQP
jgi:VWFA-related protein